MREHKTRFQAAVAVMAREHDRMVEDTIRLTPDAAKRQLAALGYENPNRAYEHLSALAAGSSRKQKLQAIILPALLEWLAPTVDPDAGLLAYRRLSEAASEKQWFLRLLRDENVVGQRLMFLLGTSPYLAELLLNSIDTVKLLSDGATGPKLIKRDAAVVTHSLVAAAARHCDPDKAIAVARSLRRAELVAMPGGPHPIPSRTRSLSPPEPMVLRLKARESRSPPGLPGGQKHCTSPKGSSRTVLPHDPTVRRGMEQPGSSSGS